MGWQTLGTSLKKMRSNACSFVLRAVLVMNGGGNGIGYPSSFYSDSTVTGSTRSS